MSFSQSDTREFLSRTKRDRALIRQYLDNNIKASSAEKKEKLKVIQPKEKGE